MCIPRAAWHALVRLRHYSSGHLFYTDYCAMARSLKIISWNTRGLNSPQKRSLVFSVLKKQCPHIICLQETHLVDSKTRSLKRPWLTQYFHATHKAYCRGVSVLLAKSLHAEVV